jgi:hypothetical protein
MLRSRADGRARRGWLWGLLREMARACVAQVMEAKILNARLSERLLPRAFEMEASIGVADEGEEKGIVGTRIAEPADLGDDGVREREHAGSPFLESCNCAIAASASTLR